MLWKNGYPAVARQLLRVVQPAAIEAAIKATERQAQVHYFVVPPAPIVEGTVQLVTTSVLSKVSGGYQAVVNSPKYLFGESYGTPRSAVLSDLVDEAAASLAIQIGSVPVEIDDLERRATSPEIERAALKREKDPAARRSCRRRGRRVRKDLKRRRLA
jgi:AAA lid domain